MPRFPSPRGDKLCRQLTAAVLFGDQFPSPRGDKLCPERITALTEEYTFPSPRGDKLCRPAKARPRGLN